MFHEIDHEMAQTTIVGLQAHRGHQNVVLVPIIKSVEIVKMVVF